VCTMLTQFFKQRKSHESVKKKPAVHAAAIRRREVAECRIVELNGDVAYLKAQVEMEKGIAERYKRITGDLVREMEHLLMHHVNGDAESVPIRFTMHQLFLKHGVRIRTVAASEVVPTRAYLQPLWSEVQ
jgi:hypothetical protein